MSHVDEIITDVHRYRVSARAHEDGFTIAWDYPGRTVLEIRILRSPLGPATVADPGPTDTDQEIVYEGVSGSYRDLTPRPSGGLHYTVFARHPGGDWIRWGEHTR